MDPSTTKRKLEKQVVVVPPECSNVSDVDVLACGDL